MVQVECSTIIRKWRLSTAGGGRKKGNFGCVAIKSTWSPSVIFYDPSPPPFRQQLISSLCSTVHLHTLFATTFPLPSPRKPCDSFLSPLSFSSPPLFPPPALVDKGERGYNDWVISVMFCFRDMIISVMTPPWRTEWTLCRAWDGEWFEREKNIYKMAFSLSPAVVHYLSKPFFDRLLVW